jgi:hypothetical protein
MLTQTLIKISSHAAWNLARSYLRVQDQVPPFAEIRGCEEKREHAKQDLKPEYVCSQEEATHALLALVVVLSCW